MPGTKVYRAAAIRPDSQSELIDDGALVVTGARIAWIGHSADLPEEYAGATVTELRGKVITPGLIDSHVHLGFDGGPDPVARMKRETDSEQLVLMLRSARELLGAGVTTARDLGARSFLDVAVRDAIDRGDAIGPRILASGAPITPTGGHCWFMGGEADGEVELRRAVRLRHRAGVDWIKVMSTGGFMTAGSAPWFAQFSEDELAAIVSDAHRLGKRVAAHAHGVQGIERAVAAGVDNLEHCSFVDENANLAYSPSLGADIARRGIPVSFTLNARSIGTPGRKNGAAWTAAMRDMLDQGLALIVGTDAGIDSVPHSAYVTGLEAHLACGVPAREVFEAATSRCADALGVGGETGRLRAGFSADFLVVDADPLTDLSVLRAHSLVVARGRAFVSAGLSE